MCDLPENRRPDILWEEEAPELAEVVRAKVTRMLEGRPPVSENPSTSGANKAVGESATPEPE